MKNQKSELRRQAERPTPGFLLARQRLLFPSLVVMPLISSRQAKQQFYQIEFM
jgi:hypothetical protein